MNVDEALLLVALNPHDNEVRRVCADALIAAGHPWGELMSLQLARPTDASRRRERDLLRQAGQWLPPAIAAAIDVPSARWDRGLPSSCRIVGSESQVAASVMHPLWTSVRCLSNAPFSLVTSCPFLQTWNGVHGEDLLAVELPKTLRVLGLFWPPRRDLENEVVGRLATLISTGLDELHLISPSGTGWWPCDCCRLEDQVPVQGPLTVNSIRPLARLTSKLSLLCLYNGYTELVPLFGELSAARVELKAIAIRSHVQSSGALKSDWELVLHATRPGEYRRATVQTVHSAESLFPLFGRDLSDLSEMLKRVPEGWFTHLTLGQRAWQGLRRLPCFRNVILERLQPT